MKIIKPTFIIESKIDGEEILNLLERAGRTAYKSEGRIGPGTAEKFLGKILSLHHESVIEHSFVTVRVICDRGVTHEWVRHRLGSYTQESTRYCNYSKGKFDREIAVIEPCFWSHDDPQYQVWQAAMKDAEKHYLNLIDLGATPQEARSVLPNSLKTEMVATMNLRSWRNFFKLRTDSSAHPQIRELAIPLLKAFQDRIPVIFNDLTIPNQKK